MARFFVDRPKFALVIAIVTALLGAIAIRFLPITQYPDITPPTIQVTASYPGATATLVRETVATPIEEQVNGVEGMIYMSSSSSDDGSYALTVTFEIGTDSDLAAVNVQNRVALATSQLPSAVAQQGVDVRARSTDMIQVVNLWSPDGSRDIVFLSNYATNFVQVALTRITGIADVEQLSPHDYSMRVWLDLPKLAALSISATDVVTAIEDQNVQATAGKVGQAPFGDADTALQFTLSADGLLSTGTEFENIIVRSDPQGAVVRLKDVARIELGSETYSASAIAKGKPSAVVGLFQSTGANALQTADLVNAKMEELSGSFPSGVAYTIDYDVTKAVRLSIEDIVFTLAITAVLVVSVTFLFLMNWRSTLIPAIAIPVSLLGTFALLYMIGFSANMITLFAIVLAITLVVDDAIVIIENAERIMDDEGLDAREATLKSMEQVTRPIIATTFALAAVFVPVCFFPGITGQIYLQFALTIVIAFILSAINALTLSPSLCATFLRRKPGNKGKGKAAQRVDAVVGRVRDAYAALVGVLLRLMPLSLVVFAAVIVSTVLMFRSVPTGFVPQEDTGILVASVQLPDGASLNRTEAFMAEAADLIEKTPGVHAVNAISGFNMIAGNRSSAGMIFIILDPWDKRRSDSLQIDAISGQLNGELAALPEATAFVFALPAIRGLGTSSGIEAKLLSYNDGGSAELDAVAKGLLSALNASPDVASAFTNFSANTPRFHLTIDRDRAEVLGIAVSDIFTALQATLGSMYVNTFVLEGRTYWVLVSADSSYRQTIDDLDGVYVKAGEGEMIPLRDLVTRRSELGAEVVYQYDLFPAASVTANLATGVSSGQGIATFQQIASQTLPDGYGIEFTGVSLQEIEAGDMVLFIIAAAVIFAYLVLVAQYESWILPLAVMASTVFAVFGALLPLMFIDGMSNNIYTQIGIVLLIGLAAKKAIMVIEFARTEHEQGKAVKDAAIAAARLRFRPVTMTGLCFILGVLPLVVASGPSAAGRQSLGIPVFSGMIVDSTLGLLMIPVLYAAFQRLRERRQRPESSENVTPAGSRETG